MNSDTRETADGLNNQVMADRETEVGEISLAAQSTSNEGKEDGARPLGSNGNQKERHCERRLERTAKGYRGF
jgi:hypothetical protein